MNEIESTSDTILSFFVGALILIMLITFCPIVFDGMEKIQQQERNRRVRNFIRSRWCITQ